MAESPEPEPDPVLIDVDQPEPAPQPQLVAEWRLVVTVGDGAVFMIPAKDEADAAAILGRCVFNKGAEYRRHSVERRLVSEWTVWRAIQPDRGARTRVDPGADGRRRRH